MERSSKSNNIVFDYKSRMKVEDFVISNGIFPIDSIKQIKNGRNSKVYLIKQGKSRWIAKKYHNYPNDNRDRMKTEYDFLTYLSSNNVSHVATPIAYDRDNQICLFSYLSGLVTDDINENLIKKACEFIQHINDFRNQESAKNIPTASEACFTLESHLKCVEERVNQLKGIRNDIPIQNEVSTFVNKKLLKSLNDIKKNIFNKYSQEQLSKSISMESRILSPSDFGFQNMLLNNDSLNFVDFEYAGWDDPAKLICDFGCHPGIPIKDEYLQIFKNSFLSWLVNADDALKRSEELMILYRVKWCCIMLNSFRISSRFPVANTIKQLNAKKLKTQFGKVIKYYNNYLS